jgi:hypothetical protein
MRRYMALAQMAAALVMERAISSAVNCGRSVHAAAAKVHRKLARLNAAVPMGSKHAAKLNGSRTRRGKYKGRLHARKGSKKRGSGRTAKSDARRWKQ